MAEEKVLETVEIPAIEVFSVGDWNGDAYDEKDLQAMIAAFDKVGFKPTVKAGHADGQEDEKKARKVFGAPALGYVSRLYLKGKKLLADLVQVPKRFADLVKTGAYRRISSEIYWNYKDDSTGATYPRVLKSVAFLGADIPALTNLEEIQTLYDMGEGGLLYARDSAGQEYRIYEREYCMGEVTPYTPADFLMRTPRKSKEDAGYTEADGEEKCANCKFFLGYMNACSIVEGYIEPGYVSDYYEPRAEMKAMADNGETHSYMIEKRGEQWCLIAKSTGKTLGCHDSREGALAQERAVKANTAKDGFFMTLEQMRQICKPCAQKMEFRNLKAVRVSLNAEDGKHYINLPAGTTEALCEKFGPSEGFRTRCMDSSAATKVDDPGAFCNALKQACYSASQKTRSYAMTIKEKDGQFCVMDDMGETMKCYPTREEAEAHMKEKKKMQKSGTRGGAHMTEEELDAKLEERIAEMRASLDKEYEYRVRKAKEEGKAEAEKDSEGLRDEIRKLQSEKRTERIEHWIKQLKTDGKLAPPEESKVRALREWIPDESQDLKYFTLKDGKTQEHTESPVKIFESLFESRQSLFKTLSKGGGEQEPEDMGTEFDDPGREVDRRAKLYQEQQGEKNNKVSYGDAVKRVLAKDADLATRYNQMKQ